MKQSLIVMMAYLGIFGLVAILAVYGLQRNTELIALSGNAQISDYIILVLSFAGIVKSLWHIHNITL